MKKTKKLIIAGALALVLALTGVIMYGGEIGDPPPRGTNTITTQNV